MGPLRTNVNGILIKKYIFHQGNVIENVWKISAILCSLYVLTPCGLVMPYDIELS